MIHNMVRVKLTLAEADEGSVRLEGMQWGLVGAGGRPTSWAEVLAMGDSIEITLTTDSETIAALVNLDPEARERLAERQVRAVTACTLELDGEQHMLQPGDRLTVPGIRVVG